MSFLARRRAEKMFRDGGWGPLLTYPVQREGRPPLVFQMRLPLTTRLVDLDAFVTRSPGAPEPARQGVEAVGAVSEAAGVILVGVLEGLNGDNPSDVLGTVTVTVTDVDDTWVWPEEGETDDRENRTLTTVTRLSDAVVQIRSLMVLDAPGREEPTPMVVLQYLIKTRYGALSMTFGSTHPGMLSEEGRAFFHKILETGFLGESPQPY